MQKWASRRFGQLQYGQVNASGKVFIFGFRVNSLAYSLSPFSPALPFPHLAVFCSCKPLLGSSICRLYRSWFNFNSRVARWAEQIPEHHAF